MVSKSITLIQREREITICFMRRKAADFLATPTQQTEASGAAIGIQWLRQEAAERERSASFNFSRPRSERGVCERAPNLKVKKERNYEVWQVSTVYQHWFVFSRSILADEAVVIIKRYLKRAHQLGAFQRSYLLYSPTIYLNRMPRRRLDTSN